MLLPLSPLTKVAYPASSIFTVKMILLCMCVHTCTHAQASGSPSRITEFSSPQTCHHHLLFTLPVPELSKNKCPFPAHGFII